MYNDEHQYTVLRILHILTFYYTICVTHSMRQIIQFCLSHCCKPNLYVTPFETNDLILCIPWIQTRWDPKVCIASCDSNEKNKPEDD